MYTTLFFIITGIILFSFIFEQIIDLLNSKNRNQNLPKILDGIYEKDRYIKSQNYGKANSKFSIYSSSISTLATLAMFFIGGFAIVNNYALGINDNIIVSALIFFGILMFAGDLLQIPFSVYGTFVIEEKFGFNKTTVKTFITDKIKGWLLGGIIGGLILSLIIWLYSIFQESFWIYAWIAVSIFSIFASMFYSTLIVPLFNKQTPLEAGSLRDKIEKFGEKTGFKIDNIFVIDGSKRSSKANAYFSGLGPKKRIVLYDTLINDMNEDEITAVLAHEIGHYKHKHTLYSMVLGILQTGVMFYIFSLLINNPELSKALGSEEVSFQLGLIAFGVLYSPVSTILGIFMNLFSRKNEYQADAFAAENGQGEFLISGLKKLSEKSLSNLTPHPAFVFMHYSHPTLFQRITAINTHTNK